MLSIIENSKNRVIDLGEMKGRLRILHNNEDDYIGAIIDNATDIVERLTGRSILMKKYRYISNTSTDNDCIQYIEIPNIPFVRIETIRRIYEGDRFEDIKDYEVDYKYGRVTISTYNLNVPIEITYISGFTDDPREVPLDLKLAIMMIVEKIYNCSDENLLSSTYIKHIIDNYKTVSIM